MSVAVDLRTGRLDLLLAYNKTSTITLGPFPADYLTGRTFEATITSTAPTVDLDITVNSLTIDIGITAGDTTGLPETAKFSMIETTSGDEPFANGWVRLSHDPGHPTTQSFTVRVSSTATVPLVIAQSATASGLLSRSTPWYDVRAYGAVADGVTDDTDAIEAALTAASVTGGTVVLPNRKTLIVSPTLHSYGLTAHDNVTIFSEGGVIKVANDAPAYESIIGHVSSNDVSNFTIHGVVFDGNGAENPTTGVVTNESRCAVKLHKGTGMRVTSCTFRNMDNVNTVVMNGSTNNAPPLVSDIYILNNSYYIIGADEHDHSTIYTHAEGATVAGNHFYGPTSVSPVPVCAIEMHGSGQVAANNHVERYREAINLTGIAYRTAGVAVTNNTLLDCMRGIRIFALSINSGASPALRAAVVSNNVVVLDPDFWAATYDVPPQGIAFISTDDDAVQGLGIHNNVVWFKGYSGSSTNVATLLAAGISYSRTGATTNTDLNISITSNLVHGALSSGVAIIGAKIRGLIIANNEAADCGHSALATVDYRCAVYLAGEIINGSVSNNVGYDTRGTGYMDRGINWLCSSGSTSGSITDNTMTLTAGSHREVAIAATSGGPYVRHRATGGTTTTPTGACAVGSRWTVTSTGVENVQTAAASGTTWVGRQAVTGSRGGNAALADLLTKLAALGLITDSTS